MPRASPPPIRAIRPTTNTRRPACSNHLRYDHHLAPFDLSGHEVRISSGMDSTHVCVHIREGGQRARQPENPRTDGVLLDVLQEIDIFLQAHVEWVRHLNGAVLNP
ncbi:MULTISPECIES: hypothetical protein [unclassified Variovorax]|uniref:hypothetical protein n=1 Tax=unclassified Variovorax TaxID=663243 RepID=UPI003ECDFC59